MTVDNKICVTGIGIISGIGCNVAETLDGLLSERCGVKHVKYLHTEHDDIPVAEVDMDDVSLEKMLSIDEETIITRTTLLGIAAAREAVGNAKMKDAICDERKCSVAFISGTTVGGMEKSEQYYRDFQENDKHDAYIAIHDCGACTEQIASYIGNFDVVTTISTACSSAANAIILGANMIKAGMVDIAVVGGSECLSKFHLNGFNSLMILDKFECRPFDASRNGLNLGEGAAYLVLESYSSAIRRDIKPLCELSGYGNACDAFHQTASSSDGIGATMAMKEALASACLKPEDVDYVNAHGTGTPNNDSSEGCALLNVFGDKIPPFSSTKSATGHTTSASGSIEAVISILAMNNNFIPANLHFTTAMDDPHIVPVNHVITNCSLNHILSNSLGFGGNTSSLIFSKI